MGMDSHGLNAERSKFDKVTKGRVSWSISVWRARTGPADVWEWVPCPVEVVVTDLGSLGRFGRDRTSIFPWMVRSFACRAVLRAVGGGIVECTVSLPILGVPNQHWLMWWPRLSQYVQYWPRRGYVPMPEHADVMTAFVATGAVCQWWRTAPTPTRWTRLWTSPGQGKCMWMTP